MMPGMGQEGMAMMQGAGADDWGWRGHGGWGPGGWGHWRGDGGWDRWHGGGWHGMRRGHQAARFMFRSPQGAFAVKCSEDEPMRTCVEAITTILDRLQAMRQSAPGQTQPGTSGPTPATPAPMR